MYISANIWGISLTWFMILNMEYILYKTHFQEDKRSLICIICHRFLKSLLSFHKQWTLFWQTSEEIRFHNIFDFLIVVTWETTNVFEKFIPRFFGHFLWYRHVGPMINSCRICSCDIGKEQFSCSLSHTLFIYVVGKHEQKVKETTTGDNFEKKEKQLSQVLFQRRTYYSDTSQKKK